MQHAWSCGSCMGKYTAHVDAHFHHYVLRSETPLLPGSQTRCFQLPNRRAHRKLCKAPLPGRPQVTVVDVHHLRVFATRNVCMGLAMTERMWLCGYEHMTKCLFSKTVAEWQKRDTTQDVACFDDYHLQIRRTWLD